jgi:hypothetical protein
MPVSLAALRRTAKGPWSLAALICTILMAAPDVQPLVRAASPEDPDIVAAVERGVNHLQQGLGGYDKGSRSLATLAILKSGIRTDSAAVKKSIADILAPLRNPPAGKAFSQYDHSIYISAVDLMCLVAADPHGYRPEIEGLLRFVLSKQHAAGHWGYFGSSNGDTSQTQMALLALWMAHHAGYEIPLPVYENAARWFLNTQVLDGGFKYHPSSKEAAPTLSMTVGGTTGVAIARMHIVRSVGQPAKFGVLERVDPRANLKAALRRKQKGRGGSPQANGGRPQRPQFRPSIGLAKYNWSLFGGVSWLTAHFGARAGSEHQPGHKAYYLYGLERMATLLNLKEINDHNWYDEGAKYLLEVQRSDGSFGVGGSAANDTSFAIMFLIRSTQKTLESGLDGGQMASGFGLPGKLSGVKVGNNGRAQNAKSRDPLDQLLNELADPKNQDFSALQQAIVGKTRFGDRKELIGQKDLLVELRKDSRPKVRRLALWAIGRCEDFDMIPLLIDSLADSNLDVAIEARNSLCLMARRPSGFGLAEDPRTRWKLKKNKAKQAKAIETWRKTASEKWIAWFERVRPYEDRGDLELPRLRGNSGKKPTTKKAEPVEQPNPAGKAAS